MKKILKYLSLTIPVFVALAIGFIITILSISVYYQIYIVAIFYKQLVTKVGFANFGTMIKYIPQISESYFDILIYMIPIIWAVLFFFWYKNLSKEKVENRIKLFTIKNITLLVLISLACQLIIIGLMEIILPHFEKIAQDYNELMSQLDQGNPVMMFISIVIIAPISEELIFRGVIFKKAGRFAPFIVANILQALLFGIFHMNIVQGSYAFGGGLAMGYVVYKYKTIMASILLHMFFNASSYIMVSPTNEYMKIIYIVIGVIIMIFAIGKMKEEKLMEQSY